MIGWLLAFGASYFFGFAGTFVACLGLAYAFPRLTQVLFATVAWPVWTLWIAMWMTILGWFFNFCDFSWASYKTSVIIASIPVGIILSWGANGVRNLGHDRIGG
jgi:hypothetical protein